MSSHGHQNKNDHVPHPNNSGYETTDAHAKPLVVFAVGLTIFTVASFIGGFVTYRILEQGQHMIDPEKHPMASGRKMPEGMPRLQILEAVDLAAFRKVEGEKLTTYGWISREAGKARVPVDKAIELVLKKGQLKSGE